ncbi:MAG: hypothetical protein M1840_007623 [Geoglossum simile]|nr:MAG: hypothetical protein M1840_007623 [Geoglossum simile]
MSESPTTLGLATLPGNIPDQVIEHAKTRIDSSEVQTLLLHSGSIGVTERVRLIKSEGALDPIYNWYQKNVNKTLLAQLMGTTVDSVARQTPLKAINLHISRGDNNSYFWFEPEYATQSIVEITVSLDTGVAGVEYVKGSHRMDRSNLHLSAMETASVPSKPGQIRIFSGGIWFKKYTKER